MVCERCAQETLRLVIRGAQLICPSCRIGEDYDINPATAIARDEIPGGLVCENYGPTPITFYSHSERRAYMKAHDLHEKEKFCPMPGTDIDPQGIPNPKGYVDAQTLKNGAELLCRQSGPKAKEWDGVEAGVMTVQTGHLTERDAVAIAEGDQQRQSRFHRRTS